jgi:murein DD-endopeptidase
MPTISFARKRFTNLGGVVVCVVAAFVGGGFATTSSLRQSFDLQMAAPPMLARVEGVTRLVYELRLVNFADAPLHVTRIESLDADSGATIDDLRGAALARAFGAAPGIACDETACTVAPRVQATAYFWSALRADARAPRALRHRVAFADGTGTAASPVEGGDGRVATTPPPKLGPPLAGGPWVAVYAPDMARGHRRFVYAVDGRARIPGRFAIDWMKVDAQGRLARGDASRVSNWYGYGADVLAVADATVAATRDDVAESATTEGAAASPPIGDASGNYVALDLGDGRFAFYEHLKPGSVRVNAGDRVRRGQAIAQLGFTGQSTGPHLHFHVADANATLAAEGLPYALDGFELLGGYASIDAFGRGEPWRPLAAASAAGRTDELPAANAVVEFAPAARAD